MFSRVVSYRLHHTPNQSLPVDVKCIATDVPAKGMRHHIENSGTMKYKEIYLVLISFIRVVARA